MQAAWQLRILLCEAEGRCGEVLQAPDGGAGQEHPLRATHRADPKLPLPTKSPGAATQLWKGQDALLCPQLLPCPSLGCATSLEGTRGNTAEVPPAAPNPKRGSLEATDTIFLLLDPKR